ncbi:MAG: AbrB/MazE/SpoVT family DNA-binding domain-containing protein [Chloroflexota bacterium]|nr:AbrB/MazE/SpoVT family DNA-binding domain-containing protein [Chloroflexota bacterium]
MLESAVGANGRITLPKAVRTSLGVQPGDRVRYIVEGDAVRIVPVRPIHRLFGALRHDGPPVSLEDMDAAIADGARRA